MPLNSTQKFLTDALSEIENHQKKRKLLVEKKVDIKDALRDVLVEEIKRLMIS